MNQRPRAVLAAAILWGGFAACGAAAGRTPFRFDQLAGVRRVGAFSLSPDGRLLAVAVAEADLAENRLRSAIWLVPASGGPARQLTSGEKNDSEPRFSPDG